MKPIKFLLLAASVATSAAFSGCQSVATVSRGQSPETEIMQTGHHHQPIRAAADHMRDFHREHHNATTSYHNAGQGYHHGGQANCPSGNCPPAYAGQYGYNQGYNPHCPTGHCQGDFSGNSNDWRPKHGYTYSYKQPNDLAYPQQNSVGGAVVYPYYTHKGPSDFFRKE